MKTPKAFSLMALAVGTAAAFAVGPAPGYARQAEGAWQVERTMDSLGHAGVAVPGNARMPGAMFEGDTAKGAGAKANGGDVLPLLWIPQAERREWRYATAMQRQSGA